MMGRGDRLVLALTILLVVYSFVALLFVGLVISSLLYEPDRAPAVQFRTTAKDRPVLETPKQVWQARTTGISEFNIDGVHYVIEDLPKEYVDYSSWYVRMP